MERLERKAGDLRSQLTKTLADVSLLQKQRDSLKEAAAAQKGELLRRCEDLEAHLKAAHAQRDAAAAELSKSQSENSEVCPSPDN